MYLVSWSHGMPYPTEGFKRTVRPMCSQTWVGLTLISVFHHLAQLPSQIPISLSRVGQKVEHSKSKSTKPSLSSLGTPCSFSAAQFNHSSRRFIFPFQIFVFFVVSLIFTCSIGSTTPTQPPPTSRGCPPIVTRAAWGARPPKRVSTLSEPVRSQSFPSHHL